MIGWLRKIVVSNFDDEELNRRAFNLNVVLLVLLVAILLGTVAMLPQIGTRPLSYVLPNVGFLMVAALFLVLCYYLSRRGNVRAGSILFTAMMTLACGGAVLVGGTLGALPAVLIIPVAITGVTLGGNASLLVAALSMIILVIAGVLEINGFTTVDYPAPETTILLNMFDLGFGLFFATMGIWLSSYSLQQLLARTRQAVVETNRYRQNLEVSLQAEQETRDRLQRAIDEYAAFLERIGQGDYAARLSLAEEDESLALLEQHINATVDTLVAALEQAEIALQEAQAAHSRYVHQAWQDYVQTREIRDFETIRPGDTVSRDLLLPTLEKALTQGHMATSTRPGSPGTDEDTAHITLSIPIKLRDQTIGVLGISRQEKQGAWTEAEQALVETVVDRLALAADGMRLLEDVQHRAARERLLGDVTARMRETLNVESVLQTAVDEIRQALGLDRAAVRLAMPETDGDLTTEGRER